MRTVSVVGRFRNLPPSLGAGSWVMRRFLPKGRNLRTMGSGNLPVPMGTYRFLSGSEWVRTHSTPGHLADVRGSARGTDASAVADPTQRAVSALGNGSLMRPRPSRLASEPTDEHEPPRAETLPRRTPPQDDRRLTDDLRTPQQ